MGGGRSGPRTATLDGLTVGDTEVAGDEPIQVDVLLESFPHGIAATGTVHTVWSGACNRCLEVIRQPVEIGVRELFTEAPDEGENYPLGTEFVDLEPMVRDAVLLEMPVIARCPWPDEDPCPLSGFSQAEQATASTGDDAAADEDGGRRLADPRWAALDVLREDG